MPAPKPSIIRAEFDVLAARTGLPLDEVAEIQIKKLIGHKQNITGGYAGKDFPLLRDIVNALKLSE